MDIWGEQKDDWTWTMWPTAPSLMKNVNYSQQILKPRGSFFDTLSMEFGSWEWPWRYLVTFLEKVCKMSSHVRLLGCFGSVPASFLGSFWPLLVAWEPHAGHFRLRRPTFTPNIQEKTVFVICMPLSSEIITFEGRGPLTGSRPGSKRPSGAARATIFNIFEVLERWPSCNGRNSTANQVQPEVKVYLTDQTYD